MNAAKWWMTVGGVLMVIMGGLGLLATHVVGPAPDAILRMNTLHAGAHLLGGLIAIANGLGLTGTARSNATISTSPPTIFSFSRTAARKAVPACRNGACCRSRANL